MVCYRGGQFNGGRMVMAEGQRENNVMEVE